MKFRISDLLLLTTFIAIMFAMFQTDLIFFRQLLFLTLTTAFAIVGLWVPKTDRPFLPCSITASFGGLVYLLLAFVFSNVLFDPELNPYGVVAQWDPVGYQLVKETVAPMAAGILGIAIGALAASYFSRTYFGNEDLSPKFKATRVGSWALAGGAMLLLVFSMLDRQGFTAMGRDWSFVVLLLLIFFVVHTIVWTKQAIEAADESLNSAGFAESQESENREI